MSRVTLAVQMHAALSAFAATSTDLSDGQALAMTNLFPAWEEVVKAGKTLIKDSVIRKDDILYRVVQDVVPQTHFPPDGEGMLAIYRPIEPNHTGTIDDPIPWVYGMDCYEGLYYSYIDHVYQVAAGGNMTPCVWAPDSGIWQWVAVS